MILLTDHYGNPCMINPEYLSIAYIPRKETETQILLTDGARIFVKETPAEIYSRLYGYNGLNEGYDEDYEPNEGYDEDYDEDHETGSNAPWPR